MTSAAAAARALLDAAAAATPTCQQGHSCAAGSRPGLEMRFCGYKKSWQDFVSFSSFFCEGNIQDRS